MQPTITMLFYTKPKAVHIILEVYANALCFGNLALWYLIKLIELYYQRKGKSFADNKIYAIECFLILININKELA